MRPLFQRGNQRTMSKVFCQPHIVDNARKTRDESGGFDPPDCIDGAMNIRKGHRVLGAEYFVNFALAIAGDLPESF